MCDKHDRVITCTFCCDLHLKLQWNLDIMNHASYNLEKVLNFSSHLEMSFNLVKVLEKYLIFLLGLEKSLKFTTMSTSDTHFL